MSRAVRNSNIPPAMRKAGIEMPMKVRITSPASPNRSSRAAAMTHARRAIARRFSGPMPRVRAMNSGTRPGGSTTTNSVAKAVIRKAVSGIGPPVLHRLGLQLAFGKRNL
jgi:hypothetical protein